MGMTKKLKGVVEGRLDRGTSEPLSLVRDTTGRGHLVRNAFKRGTVVIRVTDYKWEACRARDSKRMGCIFRIIV
jgi:hypothetical protein